MNKAMQLKARIKHLALQHHVPPQAVLQNFMLERLLERISLSKYKNRIILKGGVLISSLVGISSRTTMDLDTTLCGLALTEKAVWKAFEEICAIPLADGVQLVMDHIAPIRDDDTYGGFRVAILAHYDSIQTPLKIDITAGDVITPKAVAYVFTSNFENKRIEVLAYNLETILAEKVETILRRSVLNTRPRDFYDVYILLKTQTAAIDREVFRKAIQATAKKRGSLAVLQNKVDILRTIQADPSIQQRWGRYAKEFSYANGIAYEDVMQSLFEILDAV